MTDLKVPRADHEQILRRVREFVAARTGERELADDVDLFATAGVNSLFAMELITFLEREFDLTITVEDLVLDNFRSVRACSGFVARRLRDQP